MLCSTALASRQSPIMALLDLQGHVTELSLSPIGDWLPMGGND